MIPATGTAIHIIVVAGVAACSVTIAAAAAVRVRVYPHRSMCAPVFTSIRARVSLMAEVMMSMLRFWSSSGALFPIRLQIYYVFTV